MLQVDLRLIAEAHEMWSLIGSQQNPIWPGLGRVPRVGGFECNGLWVLQKSVFLKTAKFWGIENVYENRESRL
jgi:hypothetical protein